MVRTAAEAVNNDVLAEYTARNNQALKELTEKHGVDVRRLPDDVLAELKRISDEKVQAMIGEDPLYRRIYESYTQYRQNVMNYNELSERALANMRADLEGYTDD